MFGTFGGLGMLYSGRPPNQNRHNAVLVGKVPVVPACEVQMNANKTRVVCTLTIGNLHYN